MLRQFINWRTLLSLIAIAIVSATVFYSNYLAQKIEREERKKVEAWVEAGHFLMRAPADEDIKLPLLIRNEQTSIPIIETDENDSNINYINIDSNRILNNPEYLKNQLAEFKRSNGVIEYVAGANRENKNRYYYGKSLLLQEIRYYPLIQLLIVALFIVITLLSLHVSNRSTQNQVWAGMAKETAHQLGTPVSSLQGWLEVLKDSGVGEDIVREMEKDVERLKLVVIDLGKLAVSPNWWR